MRITKTTIKRAVKTFIQAVIGTFITASSAITWYEVDIKQAMAGVIISSLIAGLSALAMNLENKE